MTSNDKLETQLENGRKIAEFIQSDGWKLIEAKIKQEIKDERMALKEVEKKDAFTMLVEFIDHQKTMKGLERIFEIIKEYLTDKEDAENKLRK